MEPVVELEVEPATVGKLVGMFTSTPQQFLSRELRDTRAALSSPSTETYMQAARTLMIT